MKTKRTIVNANTPLILNINKEHVAKAKCKDPSSCVVAQALMEHFGPAVDGFQVGASMTKVCMDTRIIRYSTGQALRKALIEFDRTGKWNLSPGRYSLRPLSKCYLRGNRFAKIKKKRTGKKSVFAGRSIPSRKALTVCQLVQI